MTTNEKELIRIITEHENPAKAARIALDLLIQFINGGTNK